MPQDTIDDAPKLVEFCNKNIKEIEAELADAKTANDRRILRNQMLGFTELLEKALHQQFQQGKGKTDVSKIFEKGEGKGRVRTR